MVIIQEVENPTNGLLCTTPNTQLKIRNVVVGTGTLYISPEALVWIPNDRPEGVSIQWKEVSVHGITDEPQKSIYFQIDSKMTWDGIYDNHIDEDSEDSDDELSENTEMWLIPADTNAVEGIYQAMTDCQVLNPDEVQESDSDSGSDYMDFSGGENEGGGNVNDLQDLNLNDDRFADAEE